MLDAQQQIQTLRSLIDSSQKIFITSHISPDPDAVTSVLLLGTTLKLNFPDKSIALVLEEEPKDLDFLNGYENIEFISVADAIMSRKPDLFILLDANNYDRCSRSQGQTVRKYIQNNGIKTAIIDHHEPAGSDKTDVYINQASPAAVQDVYETLFDKLGLKQPDGAAQTTMLGLYADSGGFAYLNKRHHDTFALADKLVHAGASIEKAKNDLDRYSVADMRVLSELAANVTHQADYSYSYIRDEFLAEWLIAGHTEAELHGGTREFVNGYIRNIEGRSWGFIVYKNALETGSVYSASFRSIGGTKDVSLIAAKLGGGGHKPAAGARFEAGDIQAAIVAVKQAISSL